MNTRTTPAPTAWRMISQTAEYALRVVLYLAARPAGERVGASRVAAELGIPERYLARVMNALARDGVLLSARGAQGGFSLAVLPAALTLGAVVAPFDAVGQAPQCLLREQRCDPSDPCLAHEHWHCIAGGVRHFFQTTTIADLLGDELTSPLALRH
ncbi:MAG TPA: Rrf2 family transcriptional regulator [Longimicrobiales bacterium]|nr:Rrf2 family transcriptional regulator [Longimicrobiales bacterium]